MDDVLDLRVIGTNAAGYNTHWVYNQDTKTLEISGEGTLANFLLWNELDITEISTIILSAGIYRLLKQSLNGNNLTIVDFHGAADPILIEPDCAVNKTLIIYSDNEAMRNYDWKSYNTTVEWHSLSEWEG